MSTRSIVALADGDGFTQGVYAHFDGYPTSRGPVLFEIAKNLGSVQALWDVLNTADKGGWSVIDYRYDGNSLGEDRADWIYGPHHRGLGRYRVQQPHQQQHDQQGRLAGLHRVQAQHCAWGCR